MKKQLIATVVAGIILFVWQFLSWAALKHSRLGNAVHRKPGCHSGSPFSQSQC